MSNNKVRQGSLPINSGQNEHQNFAIAQNSPTSAHNHQSNMLYNQAGQEVSSINRQNEYRPIALGQPLLISAPNLPTTMFCNQASQPTSAHTRLSTMFNNQARQGLSSINNNPNEQQRYSMSHPYPNDVHIHACHFCEKVFTTAKDLGGHMRIHNANIWIKAHQHNLSATLTISKVQYALQREALRKNAQRPTSSSSPDDTTAFGASSSVTSPKSAFGASSSLDMNPKTDAERINYHTRPFLDKPEKEVKRSDDLSEESGKRSKKGQEHESEMLDLTLRL
ncbi:hypothetical protein FRX31_034484 [Thalictrum thalictroides]|uniref:C2H2-type domain-containing protein n=1 Tax=Thalictrum thalictroides TaxID=46969 RepID=A0A7J6UTZ6_THATH|nr:hypothetical protein FRX31_034484 [Thalictrum thalictroides]